MKTNIYTENVATESHASLFAAMKRAIGVEISLHQTSDPNWWSKMPQVDPEKVQAGRSSLPKDDRD